MICRAIPYEGNEPYVFLSYCHKDRDLVYPLLEQMVRDGYRVWYDDGNHAGDDWLENIANHLNNCKVCVAMISERSANSHNCRNEISFAIECKKKVLAILLENFRMPIGMRLQLGTMHYIKKQDYPSDHMLLSKLYETSVLAECKTTPGSLPMRESSGVSAAKGEHTGRSAAVSAFLNAEKAIPKRGETDSDQPSSGSTLESEPATTGAEIKEPVEAQKVVKAKVRVRTSQRKCQEIDDICEDVPAPPKKEPPKEEPPKKDPPKKETSEDSEPDTIFDGETRIDDGDDESPTMWATQEHSPLVIRLSSGEAFILQSALTRIGRSPKQCDIVLADNGYIGNCHAEIIQYKNRYYLRDRGSANGTFVNDKKLSSEDSEELGCNTLFKLHNESFLFIDDERAEQIISGNKLYYLRCTTTQGIMILQEGDLLMDRNHKWADGTLKDEKISRKVHAVITCAAGKLSILDLGSRNGTFVNGPDIRGKGSVNLFKGDQVRLGDTIFEVGVISLQGEGK